MGLKISALNLAREGSETTKSTVHHQIATTDSN